MLRGNTINIKKNWSNYKTLPNLSISLFLPHVLRFHMRLLPPSSAGAPLPCAADFQTLLQRAAESGSLGKWGWAHNVAAKGSAPLLTEGPRSPLPPQRAWYPRAQPHPDLQGSPGPRRPRGAPSPPVRGTLTQTLLSGRSPHTGCQRSTKAPTHRPCLQAGR